MIADPKISQSVRGARSISSSRTGIRVSYEKPRPGQPHSSPVTRFLMKTPYWPYHGLSRPNCSLTSAIVSGVGDLPANRTAGSPAGSR